MKVTVVFKNKCVKTIIGLCAVLLCGSNYLLAQGTFKIVDYVQSSIISASGDNAPFWLVTNRNGVSSLDTQNGYVRYGMLVDGTIGNSGNWKCSSGFDFKIGYNQINDISIQQLYADVSYKWLTLSIGQKERTAEMRHFCHIYGIDNKAMCLFPNLSLDAVTDLGTGGLVYSNNALPVPQLRLEVPEYVSIFGRDTWIKLRGHIAYGMFLDHNFQADFTAKNPNARYTKKVLYHSKALFMKFGKPEKFPLEVEGGLEMYSQFGGDIYTHAKGKYMSMPSGVNDFFKALIPGSGDSTTPYAEQSNMSGNHIGNWHLAFTLHTRPFDIRLYGEHMFEDFSQLFFFEYQSNSEGNREVVYYPWRDIMIGISVKNKSRFLKFISNISYEYMSTYDQSGACYNDPGPHYKEQMDGWDNYYNHAIYSGWHNFGMAMGNPLVFSPLYNTDGALEFKGNRVKSHHVGVNGGFGRKKELMYRLMYTYSENWGTYLNPFNEKRYTTSLLADIIYSPSGKTWYLSTSLAHDRSNYIGKNTGVMVSFVKVGLLKK